MTDRLPRPGTVTLFALLDVLGGGSILLGGAGLAVAGAVEKNPWLAVGGSVAGLWGLALLVAGVLLWVLSPAGRTLHLLASVPALLLFPPGTLVGAAAIYYLTRPGARVLFSDREPSSLAPEEHDALEGLSRPATVAVAVTSAGLVASVALVPVMGILAAIAVPGVIGAVDRSKQKRTIADMRSLSVAIETYLNDHGRYPDATDIEGLAAALSATDPSIPRMDAWGRPFEYRVLGPDVPSFAIRSSGADGVFEEPEIDLYDVRDTHYFDCDIVLRDHMAVRRPAGVAIDFPPYAPPSPPPSPTTEDPTWPEDVPASPPAADAEAPLDLVAEPPDGGAVAPAAPTSPGAPKPREARGKAPAEADLVSVPMSEAKLLHQVTPIYPPIAKKAGVHGIVVLEAIIDTSGNVTDVQVLRSVPLLDQAAMDAVRQWRFQPGQQGGRPIRMRLTVTVRFDIET